MPSYYVFDENSNKYIGMTREQIIAAIAEATGSTPTSVDDAFITKIKEQNANHELKFWTGTQAQYNALTAYNANTLYIITDEGNVFSRVAALESALAQSKTAVSITNSHIKLYGSEAIYARKYGQVASITGIISKNDMDVNIGTNSLVTFATLAEAYRPSQRVVSICQGSNYAHWMISISTNGEVSLGRYTLGASFSEPSTDVWLPFHLSWIIDK